MLDDDDLERARTLLAQDDGSAVTTPARSFAPTSSKPGWARATWWTKGALHEEREALARALAVDTASSPR